MNKSELVNYIAQKSGLSKKDADAALDAFVEGVIEAVKENDSVTLVGFGTFKSSERSARKGRNPRTGEELDIPAMRVPSFSAGKSFKDAVRDAS
jgi:DNA-binding protein HU-beta